MNSKNFVYTHMRDNSLLKKILYALIVMILMFFVGIILLVLT